MNSDNRPLKSTTSTVAGYTISRYIRVLSSEIVVRHPSIKRLDDLESDSASGRQEEAEEIIRLARKDASGRLERKAVALRARGIVDISFQYQPIGDSSLLIVATGTAVELKARWLGKFSRRS